MGNTTKINLTVNGKEITAQVPEDMTLLEFLRNNLGLVGAKNGCGTNYCGSCTVLINGDAKKSCCLKLKKLQHSEVVTIEGLSPKGTLHPIQAAFLAAGAVQCGFCTPGIILAAKALLDKIPQPAEDEIRHHLRNNSCRCTGYNKIIDAVKLSARWLSNPEEMDLKISGSYGHSVIDMDGVKKVQGALEFADDLFPKDTVHLKVVWSAYPHAMIERIDTEDAEKVSGVIRILTAKDVPGHNGFGPIKQDQPVLCADKVRYIGDAVALVVAETLESAEEAHDLVKVDYTPLPGIFSPEESLGENAIKLHTEGNVCKHLLHTVGDTEKGFGQSDLIVAGNFETPFVEHGYLEPEAGIAYWENDVLVIKAPTQFPFELRKQLSKILNLPEEKVRILATPLGGAFGSKADATVEPLLALAAFYTKRPVKLTLTREESLKRSTKRHPYKMEYRIGLNKEGKILALEAKMLSDAGAYTNLSPRVIDQACIFACGPYNVPNLKLEGWALHTNNVNASAFRGFGINQAAVALESLLDEAAVNLGLDKFDIRHKNALEAGSKTPSGEILKHSVAMKETITVAKDALFKQLSDIKAKADPTCKLGVGIAAGFKNVGAGKGKVDDAGAIFTLLPGGKIQLRASAVDMGQGIRTTLAQITRQVLPLGDDQLELITGDTSLTPKHGGAIAERQTLISGSAVAKAAEMFKNALINKAAALMGQPADELQLITGGIRHVLSSKKLSLSEIEQMLQQKRETLQITHVYIAPKTFALSDVKGRQSVSPEDYRNYPSYAYTCQVAVVEVNPETGKVRVLKVLAAHDVGKAINPQKIEGQIEGSCHMAQGYALSEEYKMENGYPKSNTYRDLNIPTILDVPSIETLIVEKPEPAGPFGAKGISEVATVPLTPAILNAIYDAVGVRIYNLPATPDRILAGLNKLGSKSSLSNRSMKMI